jgi:hypothetical protein
MKIAAVAGAVIICAGLSAHFTKSYITEVNSREKSLAELILDGEAAQALDNAAKNVEEAIGITPVTVTTAPIVTTVLETKVSVTTADSATTVPITTPVTTAETAIAVDSPVTDLPKITTTTAPETTTTVVTTAKIVTDYKIGGLIDTSKPPATVKTLLTLTDTEREAMMAYLVDHYFLDGFEYADAETNPEVKARKMAAAEMESAAIQTVNMILDAMNLSDPTKILETDFDGLIAKIGDIEAGFHAAYDGNVDPNMQKLYDGSMEYFAQLKTSLTAIKQVQTDYNNAANALLAAGLAAKALTDTVIPEIMNILESSFGLVEASQPIFLENTVGHTLLTRDEVRAILINPGYVL